MSRRHTWQFKPDGSREAASSSSLEAFVLWVMAIVSWPIHPRQNKSAKHRHWHLIYFQLSSLCIRVTFPTRLNKDTHRKQAPKQAETEKTVTLMRAAEAAMKYLFWPQGSSEIEPIKTLLWDLITAHPGWCEWWSFTLVHTHTHTHSQSNHRVGCH